MEPLESSEHDSDKVERLRRAMYSRKLSDDIRERPRRELDAEKPLVGEDFTRIDPGAPGTIIAPRTIGVARTALWWLLVAAIVFFFGALAFFGYYFFFGAGSGSATASNISISVSGPPQIEGGAPTEFQISVANRNKVPLELADLVITYPNGTRSPADFSTALNSQRISLGTIESGGVQQGTVSAVLAGNAGDTSDIKVELEYRIGGSSAIFVASTDYQVVFSSSPLSLSVDGNAETISGQPVQLTITVASNAQAPVRDVLLSAQYPFGFKVTSASPAPASAGLWQLGDLGPGQKKTVTIQGALTGAQGDARVFHFDAGTRETASSTTITSQLADNAFTMSISQPFLGLTTTVDGTTGAGVVVKTGDTVTVSINWQNNLPTAITNAAIVARLTGLPIDGSTVKSPNGFYRSTDGTILWDKTTDTELADLAPGAKGVVTFSFQMPAKTDLQTIVNPLLDISINAAGDRVSEAGVPESLQAATDRKIAIASDLDITAQGLYYSNPFGSTGPMPPKADTETTYAVVFTVTNTTNKITGATVTATLPPYIRWLGIFSPNTENVTFNQSAGTMTWTLGDINPGVGLNGTAPRQAAIAIGFTPSASQIGQQPALLQNVTLQGVDAATGEGISRPTTADVTTNLTQVAHSSTDSGLNFAGDPGFTAANATVVK